MSVSLSRAAAGPSLRCGLRLALAVCVSVLSGLGCGGGGPVSDGGPGHRSQRLALNPRQELALGRQAFREVLQEHREVTTGEGPRRVQEVGQRIVEATRIEPLQREINLLLRGYFFEWDFKVLEDRQVNAFCLPAGKVGVFTGLLAVTANNDQLAAVMGHEIAHALAHHASERIAREQMQQQALAAAGGMLGRLAPQESDLLIGLLAGGARVNSLKYDRQQESEADHIGVFLMTFAGYNPEQALVFWERMAAAPGRGLPPPKILSTHPSDQQRLEQLRAWVPRAEGAKRAYDEGRIAPPR